jgi:hypothetical protein
MRSVPATVVTGFPRRRHDQPHAPPAGHADGRRLAVIVNEFDELGIDRELLLGCGDAGCGAEDIVDLANGCLRDRCLVVQAVGSRVQRRFDWPWTPAKRARRGSL